MGSIARHSLTRREERGLYEALYKKYKSWATYHQVVRDFGELQPFVARRDDQVRHIETLSELLKFYALEVPLDTGRERPCPYVNYYEACVDAVRIEGNNIDLYGSLIRSSARDDIRSVFQSFRKAERQRYLPAFQDRLARIGG